MTSEVRARLVAGGQIVHLERHLGIDCEWQKLKPKTPKKPKAAPAALEPTTDTCNRLPIRGELSIGDASLPAYVLANAAFDLVHRLDKRRPSGYSRPSNTEILF